MTINQRIRQLRKQRGLTQAEFGAKIGLKQSAASKLEQDGATVVDQNIRLISEAFGVNPEWLRTGEGEQDADEEERFIQRMIDRYQMDGLDATVLRAWLSLSAEDRKDILDALDPLVRKFKGEPPASESDEAARRAYRAEQHRLLDAELDAKEKENSSSTPRTPAISADEKRA